jgi:hypothetical protein
MTAVARAKATQDNTANLAAYFARLTREHREHGRAIIKSGLRRVDDATYRERDQQIQWVRAQLPRPVPRPLGSRPGARAPTFTKRGKRDTRPPDVSPAFYGNEPESRFVMPVSLTCSESGGTLWAERAFALGLHWTAVRAA